MYNFFCKSMFYKYKSLRRPNKQVQMSVTLDFKRQQPNRERQGLNKVSISLTLTMLLKQEYTTGVLYCFNMSIVS